MNSVRAHHTGNSFLSIRYAAKSNSVVVDRRRRLRAVRRGVCQPWDERHGHDSRELRELVPIEVADQHDRMTRSVDRHHGYRSRPSREDSRARRVAIEGPAAGARIGSRA